MCDKRKLKWVFFLCIFVVGVLAYVAGVFLGRQYCMDVRVIDEDKLKRYSGEACFDLDSLTFNGEQAALDKEHETIYISQSPDRTSCFWELEGSLDILDQNCSLFFLRDDALKNISETVCNNIPLTLIITDGISLHKVSVIVSTLPVFSVSGDYSYTNEDNRSVYSGNIVFCAGYDPSINGYVTRSSGVEFHTRGNTTAGMPKNPWKLSLKDENGENNDLDFLGMGEDDDWILNSLTMDDTYLREKLFMDLWNEDKVLPYHKYKMSTGEYVEVVMNGKYLGLFLLQRRLDAKYLDLTDSDVLMKVTSYQAGNVQEAYEFVTYVENPEEIYSVMEPVFYHSDGSYIDLYNVIDTNLFLNFSAAIDNASLKNMYIVLKKEYEGYSLYFIPWDTDMSFGITHNGNFAFDSDGMVYSVPFRWETDAVRRAFDGYDLLAPYRWEELRQTVFIEEDVIYRIDSMYSQLQKSGAWERDKSLWGDRYNGQDTVEKMKEFISKKLVYLDEYYGG